MSSEPKHDPGLPGYLNITFDILQQDYMKEILQLANVAEMKDFIRFLQRFEAFPVYLRQENRKYGLPQIIVATGHSRVIDMTTTSPFIWRSLITAHVGACCDIIQGSMIPERQLTHDAILEMGSRFITSYQNAGQGDILAVADRLHYMDSLRVMLALRMLGLITRKIHTFKQLALGAGPGIKDMYSIHRYPSITKVKRGRSVAYRFDVVQEVINHIVITDIDENRRQLYNSYNIQQTPAVYAECADMMEFLEVLPAKKLAKRNLVTAFRIDHRMIPDVERFVGHLSASLDDHCDLIMSMGAGNTADEFNGRVDKLNEIFQVLSEAKLQPVLLKFHNPGTLEEQHVSLRFGNPSSSTYQVLYCELRKKNFQKAFAPRE